MRRYILASILLVMLVPLSGCKKQLSEGDRKVCTAAASGTANDVFGTAALADDPDIKKQASRIQLGTSDASDKDAMQQIVKICKDKGWSP